MENNQVRNRVEVYQGLPIIQEMVKDSAIVKEMQASISWLDVRQNKRKSRNFQYSFTPDDVARLNQAVWGIGERLSAIRIEHNEDRQVVIDQIKEKLSDVFLPFVYLKKMEVKKCWWDNRMKRSESKGTKASFKPDDILRINLAVAEIAARLLSIELVVEE